MSFHNRPQIVDGFIVANELVCDSKRRRGTGLIFKVDFYKAFNTSHGVIWMRSRAIWGLEGNGEI